jgi:hypothetical protein
MAAARLGVTNGTVPDQKCDILLIPDLVLGEGEAMRRREFIALIEHPPTSLTERSFKSLCRAATCEWSLLTYLELPAATQEKISRTESQACGRPKLVHTCKSFSTPRSICSLD